MRRGNKRIIGVIAGGEEHKVSWNSAKNVINLLRKNSLKSKIITLDASFEEFVQDIASCSLIYNFWFGKFGEDGTLSALLEYLKVPFVGSPAAASLLSIDKLLSKLVFKSIGIQTPEALSVNKFQATRVFFHEITIKLGLPFLVKPTRGGSSLGIQKVNSYREYLDCREHFVKPDVFLERYITGREIVVCVLEENGKVYPLPPVEIIKESGSIFDLRTKAYDKPPTHLVSPNLSARLTQVLQARAIKAHINLGCKIWSKADFIVSDDGVFLLEVDSLPGMGQRSLLPYAVKLAGISLDELVAKILPENASATYSKRTV